MDRFLGHAEQNESHAGLLCPSVSSEVAEPYPCTEYHSHGINRVLLFEGGYCKISNALLSRPRVGKLL